MPVTEHSEPPAIEGVAHRRLEAAGVDFHVAEAGAGAPILALHGWPQHFYEWRHLLRDPPAGRRVIAPDLPGYGWSGPRPARWVIDQVAGDLLALLDALELERVLLVGHDWGGWLGYEMALREPGRFRGYLALNIPHPWNDARSFLPHGLSMLGYQPPIVAFGAKLHERTNFVRWALRTGCGERMAFTEEELAIFADSFRHPDNARTAQQTYRSLWRDVLPRGLRGPERRRLTVPTRVLFGTADRGIHHSLTAPERALAEDFEVTYVPRCGHFIVDERPERVREALLELDQLTA